MNDVSGGVGHCIAAGKAKTVWQSPSNDNVHRCVIEVTDTLTAHGGQRAADVAGKGRICATISAQVCSLLRLSSIPVAFERTLDSPAQILARQCHMIPLAVVVRRFVSGSYRMRYPERSSGQPFSQPIIECFLKTGGERFSSYQVPDVNPIVLFDVHGVGSLLAFRQDRPLTIQPNPLAVVPAHEVLPLWGDDYIYVLEDIERLARRAFRRMELVWQRAGCTLLDCRFEFGVTADTGELVIAETIDPDSWRLLDPFRQHLDKEPFRNGEQAEVTFHRYLAAAGYATEFFAVR
jgi:phosphoribosylaminoimidazole-succinocarboxamide synthase